MARFKTTARPAVKREDPLAVKRTPSPKAVDRTPVKRYQIRVPVARENPQVEVKQEPVGPQPFNPNTVDAMRRLQLVGRAPVKRYCQSRRVPVTRESTQAEVKQEPAGPQPFNRNTVDAMRRLQLDVNQLIDCTPEELKEKLHNRLSELALGPDTGVLLEVWYWKKKSIRYYNIPPGKLNAEELDLLENYWAKDGFDFWGYTEANLIPEEVAGRLYPESWASKQDGIARRTQSLAMRLGLIGAKPPAKEDLREFEQRGGEMEPCVLDLPMRCKLVRILLGE
jgi:hypothetical protein